MKIKAKVIKPFNSHSVGDMVIFMKHNYVELLAAGYVSEGEAIGNDTEEPFDVKVDVIEATKAPAKRTRKK